MELKPGQRLRSTAGTAEVVVIRAASGDVDLTCGGASMVDQSSAAPASVDFQEPGSAGGGAGDNVVLGKRYVDADDTVEVLCTKPGPGALVMDGAPLELKTAKPLPSSD